MQLFFSRTARIRALFALRSSLLLWLVATNLVFGARLCAAQNQVDTLRSALATPLATRQQSPDSNRHKLSETLVQQARSLATPTLGNTRRALMRIAGGTELLRLESEERRLTTLKEALNFVPGVMVQEFFGGNDQPRLNIRGSGIQSNPQRRGVYLMHDGIPVNFADGSYVVGVLDPMAARWIEVYKGANALPYGAATLGGALNFVSRTGRTDAGGSAKVEYGSFAARSASLAWGKAWKQWDVHTTLAYSGQDGARQHNHNNRLNVAANWGYRAASGRWENRSFLHYSYLRFQMPGPLTMEQILRNPAQVSVGVDLPFSMGPNILRDRPQRGVQQFRFANRTAGQWAGQGEWAVAVYYQWADDQFVFPITLSIPHSAHHDFGAHISFAQRWRAHQLKASIWSSYGRIDRRSYINKDGLESFLFAHDELHALNGTLLLEDELRLHSSLSLIADLHIVGNYRNSDDRFAQPELRPWYSHMSQKYRYFYSAPVKLRQHWHAWSPRLGLLFRPSKTDDWQGFVNISRSYEPPTFDELIGTEVSSNINTSPKRFFAIELEKQSATTFEIGTRGRLSMLQWSASFYRSVLCNEILEVKDYVRGLKRTENYPRSLHQGLEVGIVAQLLPRSWRTVGGELCARGVWNWSDFRFTGGKYDGKRIAGVPIHFLNLALEYSHPCGLSLAGSCEWQPCSTPIDHSNTQSQAAYRVWGARAAFRFSPRLSAYVEVKNLDNLRYASSYVISDEIHDPAVVYPDFTARQMTFFIPGMPRSFHGGVSYKF